MILLSLILLNFFGRHIHNLKLPISSLNLILWYVRSDMIMTLTLTALISGGLSINTLPILSIPDNIGSINKYTQEQKMIPNKRTYKRKKRKKTTFVGQGKKKVVVEAENPPDGNKKQALPENSGNISTKKMALGNLNICTTFQLHFG